MEQFCQEIIKIQCDPPIYEKCKIHKKYLIGFSLTFNSLVCEQCIIQQNLDDIQEKVLSFQDTQNIFHNQMFKIDKIVKEYFKENSYTQMYRICDKNKQIYDILNEVLGDPNTQQSKNYIIEKNAQKNASKSPVPKRKLSQIVQDDIILKKNTQKEKQKVLDKDKDIIKDKELNKEKSKCIDKENKKLDFIQEKSVVSSVQSKDFKTPSQQIKLKKQSTFSNDKQLKQKIPSDQMISKTLSEQQIKQSKNEQQSSEQTKKISISNNTKKLKISSDQQIPKIPKKDNRSKSPISSTPKSPIQKNGSLFQKTKLKKVKEENQFDLIVQETQSETDKEFMDWKSENAKQLIPSQKTKIQKYILKMQILDDNLDHLTPRMQAHKTRSKKKSSPLKEQQIIVSEFDQINQFSVKKSYQKYVIQSPRVHSPSKQLNYTTFGQQKNINNYTDILIIGGQREQNSSVIEKINLQNHQSSALQSNVDQLDGLEKYSSCICRSKKIILIIGGKFTYQDNNDQQQQMIVKSCIEYNYENNEWKESDIKLSKPKHRVQAVCIENLIYIIGGYDENNQLLDECEVIDLNSNKVTQTFYMHNSRIDFGLATDDEKFITMIGGFGGDPLNPKYLNQCEKFDLESRTFQQISDLIEVRSGNSSIYFQNSVYTFGGYDGSQFLNSVEKLNETNKSWESIKFMNYPKAYAQVIIHPISDEIIVMGGYNYKAVNKIEKYDQHNQQWEIQIPLLYKRYRHQAYLI